MVCINSSALFVEKVRVLCASALYLFVHQSNSGEPADPLQTSRCASVHFLPSLSPSLLLNHRSQSWHGGHTVWPSPQQTTLKPLTSWWSPLILDRGKRGRGGKLHGTRWRKPVKTQRAAWFCADFTAGGVARRSNWFLNLLCSAVKQRE